jgi:peroxiredoxin Q/BCP
MWIPGLGRYKPKQGNRVGDDAPDFTLLNQDGEPVHLRDELGDKPIALVFYPRASSMVCTKQMCSLRNGWAELGKKAKVFGISYDDPAALKKFKEEDNLPFPLLSDPDKQVAKEYGVAGVLSAARVSFVIGTDGKIKKVINDITAGSHDGQLAEAVAGIARQHDA